MNTASEVEQLIRQTRAYEYSDGLIEIGLGVLFTLLGTFIYVFRDAPAGTGIIGALVLGAAIILFQRAVWKIRERLTFKRTGYVSLGHALSMRFRIIRILLVLAIGFALNALLTMATGFAARTSIVFAVCFFLFFASEWRRVGQTRWLVLGLSAIAAALAIGMLPFTRETAFFAMTTFLGLGMLVGGIYTFIRYLRANPTEVEQ